MHHVSNISESIRRMGSGVNFTTDISEWLHLANVKEAYRSSNKVHYIRLMLKHNDRCSVLDYMEDTVMFCTPRLVRYWLRKSSQPTVHYQYPAKYTQSQSVTSPNNSGRAHYPPCITAGISFERNTCLRSVQKYQINLTQRCIRRFRNSKLWTAIPRTN